MRLRQLSIRSLPGRDDIEVVKFDSAREFVDALGPYEHWSIAPLVGPSTRALESSAELRRAVWLGAYSRSRGRLELALARLDNGPIVIAQPARSDALVGPHLIGALSSLEARLRTEMPPPLRRGRDAQPTIMGPSALAIPFAKLWKRSQGIKDRADDGPGLSKRSYKLCHLPEARTTFMPLSQLPDLFVIRHAIEEDDHEHIAELFCQAAKHRGRFMSPREAVAAVSSAISRRALVIYFCRSQTSPTISLVAGYLIADDRTRATMTIADLWVPAPYRKRGVGEGLLRWAALDFFASPPPPPDVDGTAAPLRAIVALLPAGDDFEETTSRLLMRVGFRLKHQRKATGNEPSAAFAHAEASLPCSVAMAPVSTTTSSTSADSASATGVSLSSAGGESMASVPTTLGGALTTVPETGGDFSAGPAMTGTGATPAARPGYRRLTSYQRWAEVETAPGA